MTRRLVRISLLATFCMFAVTSSAFAQATRTWVSGVGDDVNPCSRTAPCKTFAGAISKTAPGGEISVLDPGGYGAVTITKSITISGVGENGSILGASTNGIIIGGSGLVVHLRQLQINGAGTGLIGIRMYSNATLVVEDSMIRGFQYGIHVDAGKAVVDRTTIANNSVIGVSASGGTLTVGNSLITGNGVGVQATGAATIRLSHNGIFDNTTSFGCGGGTLQSAGNNSVAGGAAGCPPAGGVTVQ
jgi:hypothetical protein